MYRATAVGVLAKRMVIRMGSESCSEVIEVGAGELLRLGGEGLVLLPDARRRHTRKQRRRVVGARAGGERPSFVVFRFLWLECWDTGSRVRWR